MNAIAGADKCTDDDLFEEACWLAVHASLLQDAEYVQMATADFAKHASTIIGKFVELQAFRKQSTSASEPK